MCRAGPRLGAGLKAGRASVTRQVAGNGANAILVNQDAGRSGLVSTGESLFIHGWPQVCTIQDPASTNRRNRAASQAIFNRVSPAAGFAWG